MDTTVLSKLAGLVAATHTPFHADGTLALDVVEVQAEYLMAKQVQTVFIAGSTGESHSLTVDERLRITQRWVDVIRGSSLRVIVHVGANCLADAKALATQADKLRVAAISALAPSYFKPRTLDSLVECCQAIASDAPGTPFYFYDIPSLTGVQFPMHQFLDEAINRMPTLTGIKFTNSNMMMYQQCQMVADGRFDLPWGIDEALLAALALGAVGAVGSSYNFAAPIYHRLLNAFHAGDISTARSWQRASVKLIQLLDSFGYMAAAKATMQLLGVPVGGPRLPHLALTAQQTGKLQEGLDQLGFFAWV
jgi:N-acetylneuraminate lyase